MSTQPNNPEQAGQGWAGPAWAHESQPIAQYQPQSYPSASQPEQYAAVPPQHGYAAGQQPYPPAQPYGTPGQPGGYPPLAAPAKSGDDNPFAALTDFGFKKYATPGLIKIIYIVLLGITALALLISLISGIGMLSSEWVRVVGVLTILGSLVSAPLLVLGIRVGLELVIANIRTARNTEILREELADLKQQLGRSSESVE